jgi:hypothetical protein
MKRFLERLLAVSLIATVVFASGDTMANLTATIISASIMGCCSWKLKKLERDE